MLKHIRWSDVELEKLNPLVGRQMISGDELMLARILLKKGCVVPEHSHVNEQLTYVVEGALKFWIDGKEIVVRAGEVLCIPSNMPHKAEAIEDTVDMDVFYPPRQDWPNKSHAYLRNAEPARSRGCSFPREEGGPGLLSQISTPRCRTDIPMLPTLPTLS